MKDKILPILFFVIGAIFVYYNFMNVSMDPVRMADAARQEQYVALLIADASGMFWFLPTGLSFLMLAFLVLPRSNRTPVRVRGAMRWLANYSLKAGAIWVVIDALFVGLLSLKPVYGLLFHVPAFVLAVLLWAVSRKIATVGRYEVIERNS